MSRTDTSVRGGTGSLTRTALQVTAVLCTLGIVFQGATAGLLLSRSRGALAFHGAGAIVFHVLSALMVIAAALLWRSTRGSVWPVVISALVFVLGLVQAYLGDQGVLSIHVPLAMALTLGTVWVLAWSFLAGRPTVRSGL
jgi:hypothetical protein